MLESCGWLRPRPVLILLLPIALDHDECVATAIGDLDLDLWEDRERSPTLAECR